jgi:alpha-glucosidase
MRTTFALSLALLLSTGLRAQDERRVSSPNGQVEFRIFVAQPNDGGLGQLAYQVYYRGKPALDLSWMGLDIYNQQPLLGEKPGLTHWSSDTNSATTSPSPYHSMLVEYIQDGTVGRRINVEVRAYDDGVAFRYLVPRVTPLYDIPIHDEGTGFSIVGADAVAHTAINTTFDLPFVTAAPGPEWVAITEVPIPNFPRMHLIHAGGTNLMSRLPPGKDDPLIAYQGVTPLTCPWRLIIFGFDKEHLGQSITFRDMNH